MSELHVRQIKATLEKNLDGLINLSDVEDRQKSEKDDAFLTRSQLAFILSYLSGLSLDVSAKSITDGFGDNGIDGVLYNASARVLYLGQSKWRHDGSGSIERGEIQKFIKGFRDLINARWERFNKKLTMMENEIEAALNDANTRIEIVIVYTGQATLSQEITQDINDLLNEINNPTELVTLHTFKQSNIYAAVSQGFQGSSIDLEVAIYDWGQVREPYEGFYGQVSVADVARWFEQHQNKLFAPNIRMFLGTTDVNTTIVDTLISSPRDFWYFNNGISALCSVIKKKPIGGATRETGIFECQDLHVVNGAQTVGAIASAFIKNPEAVSNARVPFRVISLNQCPPDFDRKVTRYNNTQNRIDRRDFVALDINQERIRGELLLEGVTYIYKSGETLTPSEKGFGLEEATVARACLQKDVSLATQAKREIGKLWEDIEKAPYKTLFNPSISGPSIWRAVQIVREIEAVLANHRSSKDGRNRLLAIHGNRFITHLVFQCLSDDITQGHHHFSTESRQQIMQLADQIYPNIFGLLDKHYPDAYLANLFKNLTKCQRLKNLFSCP